MVRPRGPTSSLAYWDGGFNAVLVAWRDFGDELLGDIHDGPSSRAINDLGKDGQLWSALHSKLKLLKANKVMGASAPDHPALTQPPSSTPAGSRSAGVGDTQMTTDPSRRVIITGDDDAAASLAPLLPGPERLIRDPEGWALTAPDIDVAASPIAAMDAADVIVSHLSGIARLELGRSVSLKADLLVALWSSGRRDTHRFGTGSFTLGAVLVAAGTSNGGTAVDPPRSITEIAMAHRDEEAVMLVLELLAQRPSWTNLYKIVEAIKGDVGEAGLRKLASRRQLTRFGQAANAYENALDGRHADKKNRLPPSKDPMSPQEAEALVTGVAKAWLKAKDREQIRAAARPGPVSDLVNG